MPHDAPRSSETSATSIGEGIVAALEERGLLESCSTNALGKADRTISCSTVAPDKEDVTTISSASSPPASSSSSLADEEEKGNVPAFQMVVPPDEDQTAVDALGPLLDSMCASAPTPEQRSCYSSPRVPSIAIIDYFKRIRTYFRCTNSCFVLCLVYMDRIADRRPQAAPCRITIHRLLLSCMVLAAKYHDDEFYSNSYYAKVGGLRVSELNSLERKSMEVLNWSLSVEPEVFWRYYDRLQDAAETYRC